MPSTKKKKSSRRLRKKGQRRRREEMVRPPPGIFSAVAPLTAEPMTTYALETLYQIMMQLRVPLVSPEPLNEEESQRKVHAMKFL